MQVSALSSLRASASEVQRWGQPSSKKPTRPSLARKATKFSPSSRTRTGAPSASSAAERSAGVQYSRSISPIGVPGPTRVSNSFSARVSTAGFLRGDTAGAPRRRRNGSALARRFRDRDRGVEWVESAPVLLLGIANRQCPDLAVIDVGILAERRLAGLEIAHGLEQDAPRPDQYRVARTQVLARAIHDRPHRLFHDEILVWNAAVDAGPMPFLHFLAILMPHVVGAAHVGAEVIGIARSPLHPPFVPFLGQRPLGVIADVPLRIPFIVDWYRAHHRARAIGIVGDE